MHEVNALVIGNGELWIFLRHVKVADQAKGLRLFFAGRIFLFQNLFENSARLGEAAAFLKNLGFRQHCWSKKGAAKILFLEAVEPIQGGLVIALLHLHFPERGEDAVLLHRSGVPAQRIAQHFLALCGLAGFQQGISKIHKQRGVVLPDIGQGACLDEKRLSAGGIGFFQRLRLCVEEAHAEGVLFLISRLGCHVVQQGKVFGGFGRPPVKPGEGGEEVVNRADFGFVAKIPYGLPIDFTRLFRFLLLTVIPAQVGNGLGDSGRAGMFFCEILHEAAVFFGVLEELQGLGCSEDALFIEFRFGRGNPLKSLDPFRDKALVHESIAEQNTGLAVLGFAGKFFEVVVEFIDGCAVLLELLGAIGLAENGGAPVDALGIFFEVGIHEVAAFLKLLVERVGHPLPVGSAVGEVVLGMPSQKGLERCCRLGIFLCLEEGKGIEKHCPWRVFGARKARGDFLKGRCGIFISQARLERLGLHEIDLWQERRFGKFAGEFLRGLDGFWPILQGAPAADHIDGCLFRHLVRRQILEHACHDQCRLAVAFHLEIGYRKPEAQGGVEILDLLKILGLALDLADHAGVEDFLVGILCGLCRLEAVFQFCKTPALVLEQTLAGPHALQADDGFP